MSRLSRRGCLFAAGAIVSAIALTVGGAVRQAPAPIASLPKPGTTTTVAPPPIPTTALPTTALATTALATTARPPKPRATASSPSSTTAQRRTRGPIATTAGAPTSRRPRTNTTRPAAPASPETAVLTLVNRERAAAGCPALRWSRHLGTAARLHSVDMAERNYFSHTSLDGRSPADRMRAQGYSRPGGENIGAGYRTAEAAVKGWMDSSGHRANILDCRYTALGVGVGTGGRWGVYWTQNFGF